MVPRNLRWLSAAVLAAAALLGAPARSSADTLIIVNELDGSNAVVSSSQFTLATLPSSSNPYSPAGGSFTGISITVTSTSGTSSNVNSLTTTVAAKPDGSFDASHQLQVIVTDDGFLNASAGGTAVVTNDPGASSGISGGDNNLIGTTAVQSGSLATSLTTLATTPSASDTSPSGPSDPNTTANIANLPGQFAMTQTITIRAIENSPGSIDQNSTFGGTLSSTIRTTPPATVPAPAGLVLAAAALPVLGLRRAFRRKAQS